MEVRRFARIKKVIWDQLLDAKAEIIQSKLYFRFACIMPELNLERLTRGHNKDPIRVSDYILCRA